MYCAGICTKTKGEFLVMKKITCLKDFNIIRNELSQEFIDYLEEEFNGLFEYLSNGEEITEFILPSYHEIIILESSAELNNLLENSIAIEFEDEINLSGITILRVGKMEIEDIQLYYFTK